MLAPISWLKDYVDINVSAETLAKKLVAIGFEVEEIIYQNMQVSNCVVGKITEVAKHPNADRLRVTKIDIGGKILQVVTNVPVEGGEVIGLALDGARLADGHNIARGELRGVLSEGMLLGLEEVGLSEQDAEGQKAGDILRFDDSVPLGTNVLDALGYDDVILDVAVTANRPDCNSIYKLAKEVAVALGTTSREPHIRYETNDAYKLSDMVSVSVENDDLCPRYMAAGVKNVVVKPSEPLIRKRLRAVGIRPINNIVDITNYVLMEIGQPMHAFDRRLIGGGRIVVRNAKDGESIVTLDGKENKLDNSMLVICDGDKPIAVAGIMGGLGSGISDSTSEIIFEAAKFRRDSVRRTSRTLNLRSDSSARFEKGVDFASQQLGLDRALTMIYESGAGDIVCGVEDKHVDYPLTREIVFTLRRVKDILGCNVPKNTFIFILARLGIAVEERGDKLVATVREDREDIVGVNDLAEEFIRVYGYRHIKPTLFKYSALTEGGVPDRIRAVDKIKDALVGYGLRECTTYSFTSPRFVKMLRLPEGDERLDTVRLLNPIGEALSVMRTQLTHSMLETLAYNSTHFVESARLFEVARVYLPVEGQELPNEEERLSVGIYGEGADFFTMKGAVECALETMNIFDFACVRSSEPFLHPGRGADVIVEGKKIGYFGEVHPDVASDYGMDNLRAYVAELYLKDIIRADSLTEHKFAPFTRFPIVERDLAVVVDEELPADALVNAVTGGKIAFLNGVKVFDTYVGEQVGKGKKSVALRFYFSSLERTLTDGEVNASMDKILSVLKRKTGAKIR